MYLSPRACLGVLSIAAAAALAIPLLRHPSPTPIQVTITPTHILADAHDTATLKIQGPSTTQPTITARGLRTTNVGRTSTGWQAELRSGIVPGHIPITVQFPNQPPATTQLDLTLSAADSFEDGTPDFLRLDTDPDRRAFRRWFTYIAESQYFQTPANRPAEINDCAALIRYAYREALHAHDGAWADAARLPLMPALGTIAKYQYPYTPLAAALFRVEPGAFSAADLTNGSFAQFADAHTLRRYNTTLVARDLSRAEPGDLLFYRQDESDMPFHSMIYLGESQLRPDGRAYVMYHTGPGQGEIRRWTVQELLNYPQPEWRPLAANPAFLGVFRWNILRKASES
jgi:uncharacterized protein YfaT (DUF1175 family)